MTNLQRIPSIASLPDVTSLTRTNTKLPLKWVGMESIALPFQLKSFKDKVISVNAKTDIYVSLDDPGAKGIHMSRLFLKLNSLANQILSKQSVDKLLSEVVESQSDISNNSKVSFSFDMVLEKESLTSRQVGHQAYTVAIHGEQVAQKNTYQLELIIPYSSTCPCSASLARQAYSDAIEREFNSPNIDKDALLDWIQSEAGSIATPHSQRSYAYLKLDIGDNDWPDIPTLIFQLENVIGTPVQTAVKRQDEQEFAKLNAENLMFCEDAARRIKFCIEQMSFVSDYWFKVEHQESLHAHNAVVIDFKSR